MTGTAGVMVTGVKPVLVAAYVSAMQLSESQAGLLVGLDMAGATLGTLLISWRLYSAPRARVAAAGLMVLILGNLLSIVLDSLAMLSLARLLTGLGSGIAAGLMVAGISAMPSPDKCFGLYSVFTLVVSAAMSWMCGMLLASHGVAAMFCLLAGLALPPLLLSRRFPPLQQQQPAAAPARAGRAYDPAGASLIVVTTLLYYMAVGGVWAFMGQIGRANGLSALTVNNVLGICLLAGALGALVPYILRDRLGRALPIGTSILVTLGCLAALAQPVTAITFGIAAASFMFAWISFFPYLMGVCTAFDTVGRLGALSLAVQNIGFAAGPALAGVLVERAGYTPLLGIAAAGYLVAGLAGLAAIWRAAVLKKSHPPEPAGAMGVSIPARAE